MGVPLPGLAGMEPPQTPLPRESDNLTGLHRPGRDVNHPPLSSSET
jgi:hypothetical protein